MVSRAIVEHNRQGANPPVVEEIIHTGQHYDVNMSDIFFRQMGIPEPAANLRAGTGLHGEMTGRMLSAIEQEIVNRKPDWVLVYGDTNSTLAGALAAAKLQVPVAHVEAGLRSFNRRMPEEINRVLTDHVSSLLFCPTHAAVDNLSNEGITRGVQHVGDVMYDAALIFREISGRTSTILRDLQLTTGEYYLATVHRAENTDDPQRLQNIITALNSLEKPVILPLHPRTRKILQGFPLTPHASRLTPDRRSGILPRYGGTGEERPLHPHRFRRRPEGGVLSWRALRHPEGRDGIGGDLQAGWNQVVGTDPEKIITAVCQARSGTRIAEYGEGNAARKILGSFVRQPLSFEF